MEYTGKIRIFKVEDREAVAGILSGEGYAVWHGDGQAPYRPLCLLPGFEGGAGK